MKKKLNKSKVLDYLAEYLIINLEELNSLTVLTNFSEGELWAFIDCLEILSKWSGFKKYGVNNIEKQFANG